MRTGTEHKGLTSQEAKERLLQYEKNEISDADKEGLGKKMLHILSEPMFLLLLAAAAIYFLLGEGRDGLIMMVFVIGMIGIDMFQELITDKTLAALRELSAPQVQVIRDGIPQSISSVDLVPGDLMLLYEGDKIAADGYVVEAHSLCVDESSLTGESVGVWKQEHTGTQQMDYWRRDVCYAGSMVVQGTGVILVEKTGKQSEYGKIGEHIAQVMQVPTPLQKQTAGIVKFCAWIAAVLFLLVTIFTYLDLAALSRKDRLIESILAGVTLAMAMIPEEFPVILTVFLSMGAYRLAKKHSLVKKLPSVETLGAVSVLCVDKTGTLTMNQMEVKEAYCYQGTQEQLYRTMGLGCHQDAYDPMEQAMLHCCEQQGIAKEALFADPLIKDYPFQNDMKVMGQVWQQQDSYLAAIKGSPEGILSLCQIEENQRKVLKDHLHAMSSKGLRVIAIASDLFTSRKAIPDQLQAGSWRFLGLVGLEDPIRPGIHEDIAKCQQAGIRVIMITGDHEETAKSIANQIGLQHHDQIMSGAMLDAMSDEELRACVQQYSIYSRVIPEHKLRIVAAWQAIGDVVAMSGDGVNDAPALKRADIGIAMGKRGSQVAREAADLVLLDDRFSTIIETIRDGRRIYDNIKKAIGYVFAIHMPIALASLLAPLLKLPTTMFMLLPLHVVILELMIDPTCSIVLERQPYQADTMHRAPRNPQEPLLSKGLLWRSILQGTAVFLASFGTYLILLQQGAETTLARAMAVTILLMANILLVSMISAHQESLWSYGKRMVRDKLLWIVLTTTVLAILLILYTPLHEYLKLESLSLYQLAAALVIALCSVLWFEPIKMIQKKRNTCQKGDHQL